MEKGGTTPLNGNTSVRTQSVVLTVLRVAVEGFKEQRKAGFYLEVNLAVNYEVTYVQNGIWREVKWCETVVGQDPPEKVGTRGTEAPGYMIKENYHLTFPRLWVDFVTRRAPENLFLFRKLASICILFERGL